MKSHERVIVDEATGAYELKKMNHLGVYYSDLIPILTKAIQEQQELIQNLKSQLQNEQALNKKNTSDIDQLKAAIAQIKDY